MRLIDADAFYKRYCEMYEDGVDEGEIDRIAYMLSTEPTAYDVEKVVSQLKVAQITALNKVRMIVLIIFKCDLQKIVDICFNEATRIVRKGGAE